MNAIAIAMPEPPELHYRQIDIANFLRDYLQANGYAPAIRDILRATDITSTSVAVYHMSKLEDLGFFHRDFKLSRAIVLNADVYLDYGLEPPVSELEVLKKKCLDLQTRVWELEAQLAMKGVS